MLVVYKIFSESVAQAFQQLKANKLRSFLSLLGITIGIFCIIGVQSAVDSMQDNIKGSLKKLGDDVVYVQKFPWAEDPGQNFWKYMKRPNPSYEDYEIIRKKVKNSGLTDYHVYIGSKTLKYRSNNVEGAALVSVTYDCSALFNMEYEKGRWYTASEYHFGLDKIVLGHNIAEELFGAIEPVGKKVKLMGRKMEIIGVVEKSGDDIIKVLDFDNVVLVAYPLARKLANVTSKNSFGGTVMAKVAAGGDVQEMKDEIIVRMRSSRGLKPAEENNFSLNQLSVISDVLDQIFGVFDMVGLAVGIFAILVGCFSVANIMFVSVKERTNIIGIKKAIGAKRFVILLEFLIESTILCLIGGIIGLVLIYFVSMGLSNVLPFPITLSVQNIINGFLWSIGIGIFAGLLPALQASRMDPVEAIRA